MEGYSRFWSVRVPLSWPNGSADARKCEVSSSLQIFRQQHPGARQPACKQDP
jgi:hypothetical protein